MYAAKQRRLYGEVKRWIIDSFYRYWLLSGFCSALSIFSQGLEQPFPGVTVRSRKMRSLRKSSGLKFSLCRHACSAFGRRTARTTHVLPQPGGFLWRTEAAARGDVDCSVAQSPAACSVPADYLWGGVSYIGEERAVWAKLLRLSLRRRKTHAAVPGARTATSGTEVSLGFVFDPPGEERRTLDEQVALSPCQGNWLLPWKGIERPS